MRLLTLAQACLAGLAAGLAAGIVPGSEQEVYRSVEPAPIPVTHCVGCVGRMIDPYQYGLGKTSEGSRILAKQLISPLRMAFDGLDSESFYQVLRRQPDLIGPASIGSVSRGELLNGVQLDSTAYWMVQDPRRAWGTPELVECLERSIMSVQNSFPGTLPLYIGDLSRSEGGVLRGHASHQSGRDADVGYYYRGESVWYLPATEKNFDCDRNWAFVRAVLTDCSVEYIFVDFLVLVLLREHARRVEEDKAWVESLFALGPKKPGIIRHEHGHRTHMHVRVRDWEAEALGARVVRVRRWAEDHPGRVRDVDK